MSISDSLGGRAIDTSRFLIILKNNKDLINCNCFNGEYKKLVALIGIEAVEKINLEYGGGYLSLPKKLLSDEFVYQCILNEYDGTNARELAKSLDCTYSWILKIIKRKNKEKS